MNPLLTPLPASLSANITEASAQLASGMAAEQAEQLCDMAVVPPLKAPTLPQAVLCDHRHTLTLFAHFFQAAASLEAAPDAASATDAAVSACELSAGSRLGSEGCQGTTTGRHLLMARVCAGALALDLHLHAQAEEAVLYPLLAERCGAEGALLAQHAQREHREMDAELHAVLADLLVDGIAQRGGHAGHAESAQHAEGEARARRQVAVKRLQQLEQAFIAHQVEEESEVLPRIAAALTVEEQRSLVAKYYHSKRGADMLLLQPGPPAQHSRPAQPFQPGGEPATLY